MNIRIITPAPAHSRKGNRVTALRWAKFLRQLGQRVVIAQAYAGERCDLLIALHARRSYDSIQLFHREHPDRPLFVCLTGTDLYQEIHSDPLAQQSLDMATRLILLQPLGLAELPEQVRAKARVVFQSVPRPRTKPPPSKRCFEVCVLGHLRPVKDPFRTALAARLLPASSRLRVLHLGGALSDDMKGQACAEMAGNPRYRWLGERPRWQALRRLARSRLLVLTSLLEGGANAVSEALAADVPVVSTRIAGSIGILGDDYPGYFPVGDTAALAALLERAETDRRFYQTLAAHCRRRRPLVAPSRERRAWKTLLAESILTEAARRRGLAAKAPAHLWLPNQLQGPPPPPRPGE